MTDIPKELKGEVEKLDNIIIRIYSLYEKANKGKMEVHSVMHQSHNRLMLLIRIAKFYVQPFKPEMIAEYFEGWEFVDGTDYNFIGEQKRIIRLYEEPYGYIVNIDTTGVTTYEFAVIKTLSDFIDACLNSGIKLEWKK